MHGLFLFSKRLVDIALLANFFENCFLHGELTKPIDRIVHNQLVVRVLDSLVLVVDLVFLFEEEQRRLDLHEPGLNCNEERQVLPELLLVFN